MKKRVADVTEAELAILEFLWQTGDATVRQIAEAIYPKCTSSEIATVQKLLDRLRGKLCVTRDASVWPHKFKASIDRGQLLSNRLAATAKMFCGGAMQPLLTHLVRSTRLTAKDRESLRALLDEPTPTAESKSKRGRK